MKNGNLKGYIICESGSIAEKPTIISQKGDSVIIKVTLQDSDAPNRNKRIYPKSVLEKAIQSEYIQERLATKTFYGEAGHPLKPDLQRQLYTDQGNISHIITSMWWEGNKLKGIVESANTARGRDFAGLIRQGSKVAFSLRAIGPVTEKSGPHVIVKDPLTMYCYDWVIHPSHPTAYMEQVISESMKFGTTLSENSPIFAPYYYEEALDFIKNESVNFKLVADQIGYDTKSITLSEDAKKVILKDGDKQATVLVEDFIQKEVSSYMNKIRF